jgi:hypothetical protein
MATWVDVGEYQTARPDVLAQEVTTMLSRINLGERICLVLLSLSLSLSRTSE